MSSALSQHLGKIGSFGQTLSGALSPWAPGLSLGYGIYKDLQTWRREDTAYRRAVHDMDKAGLNTFNASSVSPATSSPSTALQNYIAMRELGFKDKEVEFKDRELKQRDREISSQIMLANQQARLTNAQILALESGVVGKVAGTKVYGEGKKGFKKAKEAVKNVYGVWKQRQDQGLDPFAPNSAYSGYMQSTMDFIARRGTRGDYFW